MDTSPGSRVAPSVVLLVTADDQVIERVLSVTAALDVEPQTLVAEGALRAAWGSAPVILVGLDQAAQVAALVLPRRTELFLVASDDEVEDACAWSAQLGAAVLALPSGAGGLSAVLAGASGRSADKGHVVCVVGGSGGAGASTCASGLALVGARASREVALVDADEHGGGLDLLLGVEQVQGWRWPRLAGARGLLGDLHGQLPSCHGIDLLAMARQAVAEPPLPAAQLRAVLLSMVRSYDLVVVDLPRALTAAAREALSQADLTLLVTRADLRGVAAARATAQSLVPRSGSLAVVVRYGRTRGLGAEAVAAAVELPLAGTVPYDEGLALAAERGDPPARAARSGLARACGRLLEDLLPLRVAA